MSQVLFDKIRNNLVLIGAIFTAVTAIGGYFGISYIRPVWTTEFTDYVTTQERRDRWDDKRVLEIGDDVMFLLDQELARAHLVGDDDLVRDLVAKRTRLESKLEFLRKRVNGVEP